MALPVSVFSLYNIQQKQRKCSRILKYFLRIFKKRKKLMDVNVWNFEHFLVRSCDVPHNSWVQLVQTVWRFLNTNGHPSKGYIYRWKTHSITQLSYSYFAVLWVILNGNVKIDHKPLSDSWFQLLTMVCVKRLS